MEDRLHLRLQVQPHDRLGDPVRHCRHAQSSDPCPSRFGISTARTGGGKYVPDDIRFQSLYRFPFRSCSNSAIDSPSTPGSPVVRLDPLVRLPDHLLGNLKRLRLRLVHRLLPHSQLAADKPG